MSGISRSHMVVLASTMCALACAGSHRLVEVTRKQSVHTNVSAAETLAILATAERWLLDQLAANQHNAGGLRKVILTSVQVDGPIATVQGCGAFYDYVVPERYAIEVIAVREDATWRMHSWAVSLENLHGPRVPCR